MDRDFETIADNSGVTPILIAPALHTGTMAAPMYEYTYTGRNGTMYAYTVLSDGGDTYQHEWITSPDRLTETEAADAIEQARAIVRQHPYLTTEEVTAIIAAGARPNRHGE